MLHKLSLYYHTMKSMKPNQVYYRLRKMLKMDCSIGCKVRELHEEVYPVASIEELDYDPVFLARFSAEELMQDKITFLHSSEEFHWNTKWEFEDKSALWNYNLHYFEFLFPLVQAYRETENSCFLEKSRQCIKDWIEQNPESAKGTGWAPYTIDLRLTNWLSYYTAMEAKLDGGFKKLMRTSIYEQYAYLSKHLEKDILGNHYFEDLKALILCALFFRDKEMLTRAIEEFNAQCREQILQDGMHYELSPMYHKIILEDMLRVTYALREAGQAEREIEDYLQPMLDVAYSLEEGLERVPLFNDGGNNVAKSLTALMLAAEKHFGLTPQYKSKLPDSGYFIFKSGEWKLIVDAGQPGPKYIPGHAHCDAMSFELFKAGKPILVNCGTYAYQCEERGFFRSTAAHNTVMVDGTEQSQCWGAFRLAKRNSVKVLKLTDDSIIMEMKDQKGHIVRRSIRFRQNLVQVTDQSKGNELASFIHFGADGLYNDSQTGSVTVMKLKTEASTTADKHDYAPDYGLKTPVEVITVEGKDEIKYQLEILG